MIRTVYRKDISDSEIFDRIGGAPDVCATVSEIIADVKARGDVALREYALKFDRAELDSLEVSKEEIDAACAEIGEDYIGMLERAAANIRDFHSRQVRQGFVCNSRTGVFAGQKVIPLERVGLYVPGGTAAYPSSVLMNCIPAKLAGVDEIIMVTPPSGGSIPAQILAAARVAGVGRIFKCGGAQAVAALTYGTESIPAVDKIVGPGNAYVAEAKRQVSGKVGVDMIAGPSEILVIADGNSNPVWVAADLLSQAEHDKRASAVLVTDSEELAEKVTLEIEKQLLSLPRQDIARASVEDHGLIIIVDSIAEAVAMSNRIAPEHLELCVDDPFGLLDKVRNAGSVFLGRNCPEAVGDYMAGPNHTLPTSGTARFYSPLSVDDFVKKMQFTYFSAEALVDIADDVDKFARSEGFDAHARSVMRRMGREYE
ncbi:MAG: histidinol dehydrogenase [Clostridia bacterium]|nr:histidinol dehydrogenase [Clostridia bacterium]